MLKILQMKLRASLNEEDCIRLGTELGKKHNLLIYGMRKEYIEKLDLPSKNIESILTVKGETPLLGGDLVSLENGDILYYKIPKSGTIIEAGLVGKGGQDLLNDFTENIRDIIKDRLASPSEKWQHLSEMAESFEVLIGNAHPADPTKDEIDCAAKLEDENARKLMKLIYEKNSIFVDDLTEEEKTENMDSMLDLFANYGLVSADLAVICNRTNQQVLKVPDRNSLNDLSRKGFNCFVCGAPISNEKLERIVTITEFGKRMMKENYWFFITVRNVLKSMGLSSGEIYLSMGESPTTSLFLNFNNEALMLHLVSGKLSIDDAYMINAKISAYKLKYLILLSTDPVSVLMKSHLTTLNPDCHISFIENIESLAKDIKNVLYTREKELLAEILDEMDELTPVPIEHLIMKKIVPDDSGHKTGLEEVPVMKTSGKKGKKNGKNTEEKEMEMERV